MATGVGERQDRGPGCATDSSQAVASLGRELERLGNGTVPAASDVQLQRLRAALGAARESLAVLVRIEQAKRQ